MQNYQVITNEDLLKGFLEWLPPTTADETYYFCLFARSKYAKDENGVNMFPHIKSDKSQMKRFCATPDRALSKIRQLEVPVGSYLTKDFDPVPQCSLALYMTPNPRSQKKATFRLMKRLLQILDCQGQNYNNHAEAMSAIQKSKSRTHRVCFDVDSKDIDLSLISRILPIGSYEILETRGGYHFLVNAKGISGPGKNNWYQKIQEVYDVDQSGDQMIPVPGTYQGGFTPKFVSSLHHGDKEA